MTLLEAARRRTDAQRARYERGVCRRCQQPRLRNSPFCQAHYAHAAAVGLESARRATVKEPRENGQPVLVPTPESCGKCGAGAAALAVQRVVTEAVATVEVACQLCGWRPRAAIT